MRSAQSVFPRSKGAWILVLAALACIVWAWVPRAAREVTGTAPGGTAGAMNGGGETGPGSFAPSGRTDSPIAAGVSFADMPKPVEPIAGNPAPPQPSSSPMPSGTDPRGLGAPLESEPLIAESHAVRYAEKSRMVRFEIVFNRAPDFLSADSAGAQADSFQFHLDTMGDAGGTTGYPWETVVRGEEIHVNGDVPVRDHTLSASSEPGSGGWGPAAGSVAYSLKGKTLVFSTPFSMLKTDSGLFSYRLELYRSGVWTGVAIEDKSQPLPRIEHATGRGQ